MTVKEYTPIDGFFDLRNFDLTKKEFESCCNIQQKLKHTQDNAEHIKKMDKRTWEQAKHISAELQQFLIPKLKKGAELE